MRKIIDELTCLLCWSSAEVTVDASGTVIGEVRSSVRLALGSCGVSLYCPPSRLKSRPKMSDRSSVSLVWTLRAGKSSSSVLQSEQAILSWSSTAPFTSWVGSGIVATSSDTWINRQFTDSRRHTRISKKRIMGLKNLTLSLFKNLS